MEKDFICIVCPKGCHIHVKDNEITGYTCKRGLEYVKQELKDSRRVLATSVKVDGGVIDVCPVKSDGSIPKDKIFLAMKEVNKIELAAPVKFHQIVIENILGTGVNIIATKEIIKNKSGND